MPDKKMKVAIDISPLASGHKFRGIGVYTKNLVESLRKCKPPELKVETVEAGEVDVLGKIDLIHYPYFDLFFATLPLKKPAKTVVTIHDVTPLVFPKHFPPGLKGKIKFLIQKASLGGVSAVITDSQNSKGDIVRYLAYPKEKIYVVPLAPGETFREIKDQQALTLTKRKYKLPERFVLYVGDVSYHKNVGFLVKACKALKIPVILVGKQAAQEDFDKTHIENQPLATLIKEYGKDSDVLRPGFVEDEELAAIYNLASLYCQPSLYEGFGLPVLEAMACGCPVVAAKAASLPEICNGAALMVDPRDYNNIARGVKRVLGEKSLRRRLVKNGFAQAKKFSWEKTARETIKVYEQVAKV